MSGMPDSYEPHQAVALIVSNIAFLPAIFVSVYKSAFFVAAWFTVTMFISVTYHVCAVEIYCPAEEDALSKADFTLAMGSVPVILEYLLSLDAPRYRGRGMLLKQFAFVVFLAVIIVRVQVSRTSLATLYWIIGTGATVTFVKWSVLDWFWIYFSDYYWSLLVVGSLFSGGGLSLFFISTAQNYWWTHALWHALIFIGMFFYVLARRTTTQSAREISEVHKETKNRLPRSTRFIPSRASVKPPRLVYHDYY